MEVLAKRKIEAQKTIGMETFPAYSLNGKDRSIEHSFMTELKEDARIFKEDLLRNLNKFPENTARNLLICLLPFRTLCKVFLAFEDALARFVFDVPEEVYDDRLHIYFNFQDAYWWYTDFHSKNDPCLPNMTLFSWILVAILTNPICSEYVPEREHAERYLEWRMYMKRIPVRGVVVFNRTVDHVLMVQGWKSGVWRFPRGKVDQGESDVDCAMREAEEELGVDLRKYVDDDLFVLLVIVVVIDYCRYIETAVPVDVNKVRLGAQNVKLYAIHGLPDNMLFEPKTRYEVKRIIWVPLAVFPSFPATCSKGFFMNMRVWYTESVCRNLRAIAAKLRKPNSLKGGQLGYISDSNEPSRMVPFYGF